MGVVTGESCVIKPIFGRLIVEGEVSIRGATSILTLYVDMI